MKHWFYCIHCKRYWFLDMLTVNRCPNCGADMRGEQEMADWRHTCPICEYDFEHCQCRFSGKAHPDRNIRRRAVLDHLQYLYDDQIAHIQKVEDWWNTSGEGEYQEVVDELKVKHGEE